MESVDENLEVWLVELYCQFDGRGEGWHLRERCELEENANLGALCKPAELSQEFLDVGRVSPSILIRLECASISKWRIQFYRHVELTLEAVQALFGIEKESVTHGHRDIHRSKLRERLT